MGEEDIITTICIPSHWMFVDVPLRTFVEVLLDVFHPQMVETPRLNVSALEVLFRTTTKPTVPVVYILSKQLLTLPRKFVPVEVNFDVSRVHVNYWSVLTSYDLLEIIS